MDSKTEVKPAAERGITLNLRDAGMLVTNLLYERSMWARQLYGETRDIHKECGHPVEYTLQDYIKLYKRGDIAARVVNVWPEESWSDAPEVYETEEPDDTDFEKAFKELDRTQAIVTQLARVDMLSGVGRFGVVLLGLNDGSGLETPVAEIQPDGTMKRMGGKPLKLLFTRCFDEGCVAVSEFEADTRNPRFGMPKFYNITFQDVSANPMGTSISTGNQTRVHWSRCLHVCDTRMSSDVFGMPRMERVLDRILDLAKIAGGSAEMFWKGGFPGISLETQPEVVKGNNVQLDEQATKDQMEAYMNGLQRYIATVGMKANSLSVQIADPTPHVDTQLKLIATALSIPWRVFVGSEAAQLASEQDIRTWNRRITRRRRDYLTPRLILPFVERLIVLGILPEAKAVYVSWPDLNTPSDKDRATVAQGLADAMVKYIVSGGSALMEPFHFLTLVLGLTDEEATSVISKIDEQALADASQAAQDTKQAADNPPAKDPGTAKNK